MKVNKNNYQQLGPGTLIVAFDKLDEVETDDPEKAVAAAEFQAKIAQELESRGWEYDEDLGDWVYTL